MEERWWAWLTENSGSTVQVEIARLTGVEQSAASRWRLGKNLPKPEVAIAVARRLNRPAVEALVAAGYLDPHEAAEAVDIPAREPSNAELVALIAQRLAVSENGRVESPAKRQRTDLLPAVEGVDPSPRFVAAVDQRNALLAKRTTIHRNG